MEKQINNFLTKDQFYCTQPVHEYSLIIPYKICTLMCQSEIQDGSHNNTNLAKYPMGKYLIFILS
jgi:hypothetical protein